MDNAPISAQEIPILIIGYGSLEQGDAYAGSMVAKILHNLKLEKVKAISVDTLTPALAPLILRAKTVVFIGSYHLYEHMNPEVIIKHFLPRNLTADFDTGYDCSPQNLLAFMESVYHKLPQAYWILIPAITYRWQNHFSTTTKAAMEETLRYFSLEADLDRFLAQSSPKEFAVPT